MPPTPSRLSQTIWSAFRAAKPVHHGRGAKSIQTAGCVPNYLRPLPAWHATSQSPMRFYSDRAKNIEVDKKVEDAKDRIYNALDARAGEASKAELPLRSRQDETIVHANPEASSIVHTKIHASSSSFSTRRNPIPESPPLPSQKAGGQSPLSARFSHFMDNFQSKVFVASQRINDLTGYTGIEQLKREIDAQEASVQSARQDVKNSRSKYAEAISTRSATQREVNDLLQRKHAWSPTDLERFTNLYRSDHANEQSEQKAHQDLSDAEVRYEEASTKLARSILARYHEEQIWSDKIRQMSTWGTWGLMGLNVLLFVVLQLAIEPWRRRRLVRGFEEKVEVALASREKEIQGLRTQLRERPGGQILSEAIAVEPEPAVTVATERVAKAIVDAITGSSDAGVDTGNLLPSAEITEIEAAAEQITDEELLLDQTSIQATSEASQSAWTATPASLYAVVARTCSNSYRDFLMQFDTTDYVVLSRRDITTKVIESLVAGAALACGAMYVLVLNRR